MEDLKLGKVVNRPLVRMKNNKIVFLVLRVNLFETSQRYNFLKLRNNCCLK